MVLAPALYPFTLLIRASSHSLNNACQALYPLAFGTAILTHHSLFVYQLRALLPTHFERFLARFRYHTGRLYTAVFLSLWFPVLAFIAALYIEGVGSAKSGYCIADSPPYAGSVSVYSIVSYIFYSFYLVMNFVVAFKLQKTIIYVRVKRELVILTRCQLFATVLLLVEALSLFEMVISNEAAIATYHIILGLVFATFLGGAPAFVLGSFERNYLGLYRWWELRWWKLLFGLEDIPVMIMDLLVATRVGEQQQHLLELQSARLNTHNPASSAAENDA
jgi:hypothetical protein